MNNTKLGGSIATNELSINRAILTDEGQISWFSCSKAVFDLRYKILTETEIQVL